MVGRMLRVVGVVVLGVAALGTAWLLGMRNKQSAVVSAQRHINKRLFNPRQMASAGRPGAYASVIRHVGRSSGRSYETPVGAIPTDDGFVVALMYGRQSDWATNVLASGSATVVHDGREVLVTAPELVAYDDVARWLRPEDARAFRLFGVEDFLRVRATPA